MRSIRLSLVIYFLVLLGAALGAVSVLAYQLAARSLEERHRTYRELARTRYEERRRAEIAKIDSDLLFQARALANLAQATTDAKLVFATQLYPLGALNAGVWPGAQFLIPSWLAQYHDDPLARQLARVGNKIQLNEDVLYRGDDRPTDFLQINDLRGATWKSRNLGERSLPFDGRSFYRMKVFTWQYDDVTFDGKRLRRVMMKVPVLRFDYIPSRIPPPVRPSGGTSRPSTRGAGSLPMFPRQGEPWPFFIQCAADRSEIDSALAALDESTKEELQGTETEAAESLNLLQWRLIWISVATFFAVCLGASLLIRTGLSPLRRLSDAVSRVSETNIQLDFKGPKPPLELEPMVERIQHMLAMLQHAFDREKQATADISHELRTPLAGLMTTLDVALRKPRTPQEYRESLQECRGIVRQMSQMVERLMTLTWLDARSDSLRLEATNVADLADQCAAVIRPLAKARNVELRMQLDAPSQIETDVTKLREIISNLLHNAVEYNRIGGTIDLNVRTTFDGGLNLEVRDTGIGIEPEMRERIFERFYRADSSRQATGLHAGLGLAIVRGFVDLMGGRIDLESEVGVGSIFRVTLPPQTDSRKAA